jgi:hypothetical protein
VIAIHPQRISRQPPVEDVPCDVVDGATGGVIASAERNQASGVATSNATFKP